jgi:regulator of cell morphogenesis and NO signaling
MPITKDQILIEVVQDNPLLASVVDRFGISYSNWTLSLEQACEVEQVDSQLLIQMLLAFQNNNYFPKEELTKLPLQSLIEYLIKTHVYYLTSRLPKIEQFIDLLIAHYGRIDMHLYLLKDYFQDYKRDMMTHIFIEERDLFPYVLKLIKASEQKLKPIELFNVLEPNAIARFNDDHHHIEDELSEIRKRLNNYTENNQTKIQVATLFYELRLFEIDLLTHGRLEDEVLIPRAAEVESKLKIQLLNMARLS